LASAQPDLQSRFKKPGRVRAGLRLWGTLGDESAGRAFTREARTAGRAGTDG
jgi:hypothetical protein